MLLIGSAAGVAVMGMERRISWLALIGYVAGALAYLGQYALFG